MLKFQSHGAPGTAARTRFLLLQSITLLPRCWVKRAAATSLGWQPVSTSDSVGVKLTRMDTPEMLLLLLRKRRIWMLWHCTRAVSECSCAENPKFKASLRHLGSSPGQLVLSRKSEAEPQIC
uniref:Uncharacterized protein n=1 Tax=Physcomitrium patens TaxID=3218 RepID=A0A2K1L0K2_PHYPA|nr:hypothetical protein PHYPA_002347 [Physcomitrium patens]